MPRLDLRAAFIGTVLGVLLGRLFIHLIGSWQERPVAATAGITIILLPALIGAILGACRES